MWNPITQVFLTGAELRTKFKLGPGDLVSYDRMIAAVPAS
jgi:hypothetical protein